MLHPIAIILFTLSFQGISKGSMVTAPAVKIAHGGLKSGQKTNLHSGSFRIVGGSSVVPHSKPFLVRLVVHTSKSLDFGCGGSILDESNILTAAHCLEDASSVDVLAGRHDLDKVETSEQKITSKVFTVHNLYNYPNSHDFDIAIIHLPNTFKWTEFVQPAKLASAEPPVASPVESVGWGNNELGMATSEARTVTNHVLSDQEASEETFANFSHEQFICTDMDNKKGTCVGDSGGPMLTPFNEVAGITAFGDFNCLAEVPQCFTSTVHFKHWILANTKKSQ